MKSALPAPVLRGVVCAVPAHIECNDLASQARFVATTGVKERRVARGQRFIDLADAAARTALDRANVGRATVDAVIVVTQTGGVVTPGVACHLQHGLGLRTDAAAFDVNLGCSGYPYALWMGAQMLAARDVDRVLLVVGDVSSSFVDPDDPATGALFGDAVSATILDQSPAAESCWWFVLGSDGSGARALYCDPGGRLQMNGADVFSFTLRRVPQLFSDLLASSCLSRDKLDYVLMHQANRMMLEQLARKMNIGAMPGPLVPSNIYRFGNTSSASVPMLMADEELEAQTGLRVALLHRETTLAMLGYGVGLSWAGMIGRVNALDFAEIVEV